MAWAWGVLVNSIFPPFNVAFQILFIPHSYPRTVGKGVERLMGEIVVSTPWRLC